MSLHLEAASTYFIVFGLTRLVLEPMIYHTRGEHANHYTTDAVTKLKCEQWIKRDDKIKPPFESSELKGATLSFIFILFNFNIYI
jgi:hypothetical protein